MNGGEKLSADEVIRASLEAAPISSKPIGGEVVLRSTIMVDAAGNERQVNFVGARIEDAGEL